GAQALAPAGAPLGGLVQSLAALRVVEADPFTVLGAPCDAVAFSPDGARIASGAQDPVVRVWGAATGHQPGAAGGHARSIRAVAFSRDGRRLASASGGIERKGALGSRRQRQLPIDMEKDVPDLKVWDAATGRKLLSLSLPGKTQALAISPD